MSPAARKGQEVPEDAIEAAERGEGVPAHTHDGVSGEDGTLLEHLRRVHRVEAADHLSPATQEGLHDRVHGSTGASDH
ncbi:MAG: hypothetical protein M3N68_07240 [Actinomycetota bacterium]|nr:hypothetical protein [Actinomycetota bacterium]